jgi:hypothetical protein
MKKRHARPVKTERDYKGAASAADQIRNQTERQQAEEHRLQELIHALEKFDDQEEDEDSSDVTEDILGLPRRRWSDEGEEEE